MILRSSLLAAAALSALLAGCATGTASTGAAPAAATAAAVQAQRQAPARGIYELAYSPRQNAVFVASSGGFGADAAPAKVLRLNPQTLAVEREIVLERKAFGVTLDDAGGRLYVGNTVDLSVTVVDIVNNRVVGVVQLEPKVKGKDGKERYARDLRELAVDPASKRLFLQGHSGEGSVLYVVNTETLKVDKILPGLGNAKAPGLAFDAAGQRLFVTNLLGELITISTRTLEITQRIKTDAEQPMNIAFDAATQRLFVTDQGAEMIRNYQGKSIPGFKSSHPGNRVAVFDANTGRQLHSIPTGAGPMGVLLDAQRKRLYVTNRDAGTVSFYDSASYAPLGTVSLPTHPNSLSLDAQRNVLYVSIKNGKKDPKDAAESVARIVF
ncbi:YncE family protein [Xenophilus arseniciresistens]|uniref:YncE family protein n=1 Tax=Xenophilus arseniciresistens TaxID=1283306 RepID=A0AAE3SZQ1_9BURK|nr:YncE family protein [Xenophilus arseniciresistens]MDA7417422.1 YncE family protein [Xenophilus arseniciresistens]